MLDSPDQCFHILIHLKKLMQNVLSLDLMPKTFHLQLWSRLPIKPYPDKPSSYTRGGFGVEYPVLERLI